VVPDLLLGNPAQCVVECLNAQLRPQPVVSERSAAGQDRVALVHQHSVIDLQQQARVHNGLVFLAERVGQGEHELLIIFVVLIGQPVRARRGHNREEAGDLVVLAER
jgi:hypothetical protein